MGRGIGIIADLTRHQHHDAGGMDEQKKSVKFQVFY